MEMPKSEEVLEIKNSALVDFYPENLQNSKLLSLITEQLTFNLQDLSKVFNKKEVESINLLKNCNFLNISEDTVEYVEEEINNIFICDESYLNEKIIEEIRYIKDVEYSRFYRKNNYKWVFVPTTQSKQNFLNFIKSKNIKMFNLKKSSIVNNINYINESYGLKGGRKNSDFSNNGNNKWRKYSKNYAPHKGSHNSNYYNNYYKGYKGRERFNSDSNNYMRNNNEYSYSNNSNSNNYIKKKEKIEVEIGEIKYPLTINYKYSISSIKDIYQKLKEENYFETKPVFLVEDNEILNNKPKNLQIIQTIDTSSNRNKNTQAFKKDDLEDKNFNKIKIPKCNPLSQMKKPFNKFDSIPDNSEILVK